MGSKAYNFIDFLVKSKQKLWQILPINSIGYGNSPYNPISSFAGNTLLISPELLLEDDYLNSDDINNIPSFKSYKVEFEKVIKYKNLLYRKAFKKFSSQKDNRFNKFCQQNHKWLDDFALFCSLRKHYKYKSWHEWDKKLVQRDTKTLRYWIDKLKIEIQYHKFLQYIFFKQWMKLKDYAKKQDIKMVGDIPIFVSYDSADVWTNQELFLLNRESKPAYISGVPPDDFSEEGQLWGNPLYDWKKMKEDDYKWWRDRISHLCSLVDYIRIDHFIGFIRFWKVQPDAKTAKRGEWGKGPDSHFFSTIKKYLGELPIIAEDLGIIIPQVIELKNQFGFPGMRILQFSFGYNDLRPQEFEKNSIAYTGTHDNEPIKSWFEKLKNYDNNTYETVCRYINYKVGDEAYWKLILVAYTSPSQWAIIPLQDILGLGEESRMNNPGTIENNWNWRFKNDELNNRIVAKLKEIVTKYNRYPC